MSKPRLIAFYLPQFYPTPENDEWWGKGFTEWTNVGRAKPLFKGHCQPRVPADLGYYDLRVPEVREEQAEFAKEAGIEGFCYWHYWFAGRRLLERVFSEVVESGKPEFPFCLCWANHSWYQKTWDPTKPDKLLIEQTYPGEEDYVAHFNTLLPAFKDKRYMKVNGRLIFGIFDADRIPSFDLMKTVWTDLAKKNGLEGFFFYGLCQGLGRSESVLRKGYDAIVFDNLATLFHDRKFSLYERAKFRILKSPHFIQYKDYAEETIRFFSNNRQFVPCLVPNFDHSPRSQYRGVILHGNTPDQWERLCREIVKYTHPSNNLLFIKSWNEWGEGNYLEPDMVFGKQYIEATRRAINV